MTRFSAASSPRATPRGWESRGKILLTPSTRRYFSFRGSIGKLVPKCFLTRSTSSRKGKGEPRPQLRRSSQKFSESSFGILSVLSVPAAPHHPTCSPDFAGTARSRLSVVDGLLRERLVWCFHFYQKLSPESCRIFDNYFFGPESSKPGTDRKTTAATNARNRVLASGNSGASRDLGGSFASGCARSVQK